ncbi:hypothetical protein BDZ89DRAFT_134310 [Hymenopellis radicata]|nr:hypothetical protein BDZ89DRAFT_134310 [Hymenopellis radicata]
MSSPSASAWIVEVRSGHHQSFLKATQAFKAGQDLASLDKASKAPRSYRTVQCGPKSLDHVELNSDFVYVNHSCEPNLAFDLSAASRNDWCIRAERDIRVGQPLTFFYPSTEWDMDEAFRCQCGTPTCLGEIRGAKYLHKEELLGRGWINLWIWKLLEQHSV